MLTKQSLGPKIKLTKSITSLKTAMVSTDIRAKFKSVSFQQSKLTNAELRAVIHN